MTNDAWFGIFSGPQQHLTQTQARAIEQGLPVVRVANTGISALVDPYGRILKKLGINKQGSLDVRLPTSIDRTFYNRIGARVWNYGLFFIIVFLTLLCLIDTKIKR